MRTALGIAYDGTDFSGWQSQSSSSGIQDLMEGALAAVLNAQVRTFCCGRTDAGVHAELQVIHFDHEAPRPETTWLRGVNDRLPPSIRVLWGKSVSDEFHARFSALSRRYRYHLLNQSGPNALRHRYTAWGFHPLELAPMQEAASMLLGVHDFSAFRSVHCQSKLPERDLMRLHVEQLDNEFQFHVEASGFLHNMVRILIGNLVRIGAGEEKPRWILDVLNSKDRTRGGVTMPASGLFFCGASYPEKFKLL